MANERDMRFETAFRSDDIRRDNFLSRLFGLFSEDVVRHWCSHPEAKYEDIGRPTVKVPEDKSWGHTLDFTLRNRESGKTFVAEMKCEIAFENYKYMRLTAAEQLEHHKSPAFKKFLLVARDPPAAETRVSGRPISVDGAILVWGSLTDAGRSSAISEFGFADVLSIEEMLHELASWESSSWRDRVRELGTWSKQLFDYLAAVSD